MKTSFLRTRNFIRHGALGLFMLLTAFGAMADRTYTLGVVPQFEQRKLFAIWKPVADELSRRSGMDLRLVVTLSVPEFEAELEKGSFDFVYANPYHILRVSTSQGYIPLVRDREPLRGIVVVRKDSPLASPRDLAGRTLAVPSPNALGASLLIRAELERLYGVQTVQLNARTHSSAYLHVLNGLTEAGGGVQKTLGEQPAEIRDQLRILHTTQEIPSHPIAAHPRIPAEVQVRLKDGILKLSASPAGRALLEEIPMAEPIPASLQDYTVLRRLNLDQYWLKEGK